MASAALWTIGVGFATTADAYWRLLAEHDLKASFEKILGGFNPENLEELAQRGHAARTAVVARFCRGARQKMRFTAEDAIEPQNSDVRMALRIIRLVCCPLPCVLGKSRKDILPLRSRR